MNHPSALTTRLSRKQYSLLLIAFGCSACTPIPIYQPPANVSESAHIRLSLKDESLLSGVATISQIEGNIVCGEPLPNLKRLIVISKGNPLISNLNASGTYIPTGQKFTFSAIGLNDGFRGCGKIVSFVPQKTERYEITMANATDRSPSSAPVACPIQVTKTSQSEGAKGVVAKPVAITYEQCQAK